MPSIIKKKSKNILFSKFKNAILKHNCLKTHDCFVKMKELEDVGTTE